VRFVRNLSHGGKSGRETGSKSSTAASGAEGLQKMMIKRVISKYNEL
jgi:hypothetical protein